MGTAGLDSCRTPKDWTILVYGGGVNNLDQAIRKNWENADDRPLPENVDVFVRHIDHNGRPQDVHMSSQGTTLLKESDSPVDSSSPEVMAEFFREGVRKFPAKRYVAVVSSHGKGAEGVIEDDRSHRLASPQEFKTALDAGKAENQGKPIDVVLFDACRMAAVEMAAQLVGSAAIAVASMDNVASVGYSLSEVIASASRSGDAHSLALELVSNNAPQQLGSCLTLAAVDLERLDPLQKAFGHLAEELRGLPPESAKSVRRVSESTRRNTVSPDSWELLDMLSSHILSSPTFDQSALDQWLESVEPGQAVAIVAFCQDLLAQRELMDKHPALGECLHDVISAHDHAVFAVRAHEDDPPGGLTVSLPLISGKAPLYPSAGEGLTFETRTGWSQAVHVVVPADEPAERKLTWLEQELLEQGVALPSGEPRRT